jgi:hypothetical protein
VVVSSDEKSVLPVTLHIRSRRIRRANAGDRASRLSGAEVWACARSAGAGGELRTVVRECRCLLAVAASASSALSVWPSTVIMSVIGGRPRVSVPVLSISTGARRPKAWT